MDAYTQPHIQREQETNLGLTLIFQDLQPKEHIFRLLNKALFYVWSLCLT